MKPIPIAQGLLILISYYQKKKELTEHQHALLKRLRELYSLGTQNKKEIEEVEKIIREHTNENGPLAKYRCEATATIISHDASKRYYESILAFEILKEIKSLDLKDLKKYHDFLFELLPSIQQTKVRDMFRFLVIPITPIEKSAVDALARIQSEQFYLYSEREKLKLLLIISVMPLILIDHFDSKKIDFPLNIYHSLEVYRDKNRGRKMKYKEEEKKEAKETKEKEQGTHSQALGIMQSHMPLSSLDVLFSKKPSSHTRTTDLFRFVESEKPSSENWIEFSFNQLVHPFVASISGSMLCQLQALAYLYEKGKVVFHDQESLSTFFRSLISFFLYMMGNHSLLELTQVIRLPVVIELFSKHIKDFDKITMASLFFKGKACEIALAETIKYNEFLLRRMEFQEELKKEMKLKKVEPAKREDIFDKNRHTAILNLVRMAIEVPQKESKEGFTFQQAATFFSPYITVNSSVKFQIPREIAKIKKIYDEFLKNRTENPAIDNPLGQKVEAQLKKHVENYLIKNLNPKGENNPLVFFYLGIQAILDNFENIEKTKKNPNKLDALIRLGKEYYSKSESKFELKS